MRLTGATTLYEYWHGGRSYSHPMFGAPVRYLFQYLLGLRQAEGSCAWREIVFDPYLPEGINALSGSLETPQGVLRARLWRENGEARAEIFAQFGQANVAIGIYFDISSGWRFESLSFFLAHLRLGFFAQKKARFVRGFLSAYVGNANFHWRYFIFFMFSARFS